MRQEAVEQYARALKAGQKYYKDAVTRGEKGRMLGLDAVFLLVYLAIGALASLSGFLALAALFVLPYHKAVRAELYGALRYKGAKEGLFSPSEIGAELFD